MTYTFPPSLHPLRDYLRGLGADTLAFVSDRQAAYMAQQLLNTRVKFPPKGSDMTPALFLIQKAVTEKGANLHISQAVRSKAISAAADLILRDGKAPKGKKPKRKAAKIPSSANSNKHHKDFRPEVFSEGVHIFCDGASVPNPGLGGWGVAIYRDGIEIGSAFCGEADTTNNKMELTALLHAIEKAAQIRSNLGASTIWCDSQYAVKGANEWRLKWRKHGWKKSAGSPEQVKNVDLWKAIDEALEDVSKLGRIYLKWVKGHAGVLGNERADELAEQGRESVQKANLPVGLFEDLDAQYRAIMAG
jgi:ribonuclease HI